jgi:protein-tyrosine phosphatase
MTAQLSQRVVELGHGIAARTFTLLEAQRIAKVTGDSSVEALHRNRDNLSLVGREDISDPVGLSPAAYCAVGDRIAEALVPLIFALHPRGKAPPREQKPLVFRRPEVPKRQNVGLTAAASIETWH